jgi:hypothetical protein
METREIKISRETAERWYNGCDKELKELALQTYPELKPKYEVGKWYKATDQFFRCTRLSSKGLPFGYGWGRSGNWNEDDEDYWKDCVGDSTEATHEEVEQRFKEEAKKRGYYDKPFLCLHRSDKSVEGYYGDLFWTPKGCVFDNGRWAEFVKEPEYKIGEVYAFADDEMDFEKGNFEVGKLTNYYKEDKYRYELNESNWHKHIRKIEYKFLD